MSGTTRYKIGAADSEYYYSESEQAWVGHVTLGDRTVRRIIPLSEAPIIAALEEAAEQLRREAAADDGGKP